MVPNWKGGLLIMMVAIMVMIMVIFINMMGEGK